MKSLLAFTIMGVWTGVIGLTLYFVDAHLNYRELNWALGIATVLLATHMINMVIYFKVAGNAPYKWFADSHAGAEKA